jgi:hypothetical protein
LVWGTTLEVVGEFDFDHQSNVTSNSQKLQIDLSLALGKLSEGKVVPVLN